MHILDAVLLGQAVAPLVRILPAILRIFPEILKDTPKLGLGKVIPIINQVAEPERDLARQLQQKFKLKEKEKFRDSAHVVRCDDVKNVLEKELDGTLLKDVLLALGRNLMGATNLESAGAILGNRIMDKIREKVLVQTAVRKRITYRYAKREI